MSPGARAALTASAVALAVVGAMEAGHAHGAVASGLCTLATLFAFPPAGGRAALAALAASAPAMAVAARAADLEPRALAAPTLLVLAVAATAAAVRALDGPARPPAGTRREGPLVRAWLLGAALAWGGFPLVAWLARDLLELRGWSVPTAACPPLTLARLADPPRGTPPAPAPAPAPAPPGAPAMAASASGLRCRAEALPLDGWLELDLLLRLDKGSQPLGGELRLESGAFRSSAPLRLPPGAGRRLRLLLPALDPGMRPASFLSGPSGEVRLEAVESAVARALEELPPTADNPRSPPGDVLGEPRHPPSLVRAWVLLALLSTALAVAALPWASRRPLATAAHGALLAIAACWLAPGAGPVLEALPVVRGERLEILYRLSHLGRWPVRVRLEIPGVLPPVPLYRGAAEVSRRPLTLRDRVLEGVGVEPGRPLWFFHRVDVPGMPPSPVEGTAGGLANRTTLALSDALVLEGRRAWVVGEIAAGGLAPWSPASPVEDYERLRARAFPPTLGGRERLLRALSPLPSPVVVAWTPTPPAPVFAVGAGARVDRRVATILHETLWVIPLEGTP
ncbi:MAG: hypothetical protein HY722_07040 [Planctomycetes bacterium]|nr:hypothetical protein [Planctomycetota bacterium]